MEKNEILMHLREFIKSKQETETDQKMTNMLALLEGVEESDIEIGDEPKYFNAYLECNSTGVGESNFGGTRNRRTVSLDYNTDVHLFVDGHLGAGKKGLSLFVLKPEQSTLFYSKDDIIKVAKEHGFKLHSQKFRDLNFMITDHRVNRYKVHITKGPKSYPIRPIVAMVNDKGEKCTIGYIYEQNGEEYIIIEPDSISSKEKGLKFLGCAPWMFFSFIFPPLFIAVFIVMYVKYKKERMIG